MYILYRQANIV